MIKNETIAAIATGLSNSGIGIIRISGENAVDVADKIFYTKDGLKTKKSHTISYGYIADNGEIVDEVLVMLMKAPKTYTGENTVEINCHGGIVVLQKVLKLVLKAGARLAEPGEFTKRAFLNGKMDLSKAEAVIDIINAKNEYALKSGISQLNGNIKNKIYNLREKILHEIAFIESALDDPENYSLKNYPKKLENMIKYIKIDIEKLIKSFENGKIIKEGVETAIIGRPNAGKSSLLNLLVKDERAIVSDIEGTTRDTIREYINLGGINLNITDTAGIRKTLDNIEKIGVEKARDAADKADFVILVTDSTKQLCDEDKELFKYIEDKKAIILLNKADINPIVKLEDILKYSNKKCIVFSTKDNIGLDELESEIKSMFYKGDIDFNDEIYITNARHIEALESVLDSLDMVLSSIEEGLPEDFYSIDMLNAYESLGIITGEALEDDLINKIFSKFCMGK
jgi:tRNA modification GTPase trmE